MKTEELKKHFAKTNFSLQLQMSQFLLTHSTTNTCFVDRMRPANVICEGLSDLGSIKNKIAKY